MSFGPLYALLALASFIGGVQNALAGGGLFLIFPALVLTGLDPRAANITATIALFPGQAANGFAGRRHALGTPSLTLRSLVVLSFIGGALGALLLLVTPVSIFSSLVPWLVLFATLLFAWGSFAKPVAETRPRWGKWPAAVTQLAIAIYGGYFGGGVGILMLAVMTLSGLALSAAGATKNILACVMNASAVVVFLFSPDVAWQQAAVVGTAALAGGQLGALALARLDEKILRTCILVLGFALTIGLFVKYGRG